MMFYVLVEEKITGCCCRALVVYGTCGAVPNGPTNMRIAEILEPESINPCLSFPRHQGQSGILTIINLLKDWRKRNGIKEPMLEPSA